MPVVGLGVLTQHVEPRVALLIFAVVLGTALVAGLASMLRPGQRGAARDQLTSVDPCTTTVPPCAVIASCRPRWSSASRLGSSVWLTL